jgi:hypothetical protein
MTGHRPGCYAERGHHTIDGIGAEVRKYRVRAKAQRILRPGMAHGRL